MLQGPDGQPAVVVGGSVPAVHDGWMWDLTVPGNNDHDFYVEPAPVLPLAQASDQGSLGPSILENCSARCWERTWVCAIGRHVPTMEARAVAYFPDLSAYSYSSDDRPMLNVGWLGRGKSFEMGDVGREAWDELVRLASDPVNIMRGLHDCEFCDVESPVRVPSDYSAKGFASLGTGEIRVRGEGGRLYVAPTLLLHYIQSHNYLPPEDFIQAVYALRKRRIDCGTPAA